MSSILWTNGGKPFKPGAFGYRWQGRWPCTWLDLTSFASQILRLRIRLMLSMILTIETRELVSTLFQTKVFIMFIAVSLTNAASAHPNYFSPLPSATLTPTPSTRFPQPLASSALRQKVDNSLPASRLADKRQERLSNSSHP
ncbi:hypothetical protein SISNIDRAFT_279665 [Sistotremastrum niveocremeum HHB9708]|uniref:Uncharacterized protein n=1 Tax=Sistotremastrum niveocremeum HHB9708 TaxID=1314777 RepID=A0A164NQW3_9AGAM|nr:hypothetical protein SISNIDRAFT_279665 [Sistotremastrum niveocremeum HHB9708]